VEAAPTDDGSRDQTDDQTQQVDTDRTLVVRHWRADGQLIPDVRAAFGSRQARGWRGTLTVRRVAA
jgi:hypothetical protein